MTATLNRVEITPETDRPDLPAPSIVVRPFYDGVDRPEGMGVALPDTASGRKLAERLKRAIEAGVAHPLTGVGTDNAGKTYALTSYNVRGRCLNADLKGLGF